MNLDQIKKDIAKFERFKADMERQQVTFPLDAKSTETIRKDILVATGSVIIPANLATYGESIEVKVNKDKYWLETTAVYVII